jgi:hypothetical protein
MHESQPDARQLLRHTLATLAYRGGKVLRDAPAGFESFNAGGGTRSAGQVLAHVCDLLDWCFHLAEGEHVWSEGEVDEWPRLRARFFAALERADARLAAPEPLGFPPERIFQGPVADAFTHVGQLAMLRRLAGHPVRGENYFRADITAGTVGEAQPAPRREF